MLQKKMCPEVKDDDYLFRNHQTNTFVDKSTFSKYWNLIMDKIKLSYSLRTFRSHRITQLVLSGVEIPLVARSLGLSASQIIKTYLRYNPAANWEKLIQPYSKPDNELRMLISHSGD